LRALSLFQTYQFTDSNQGRSRNRPLATPLVTARLYCSKISVVCQPPVSQFLTPLSRRTTSTTRRTSADSENSAIAREFAALTFKLLVPIRRLQTAQAISQNDLRTQAPNGCIETVVPSAWHGLPAMIGFYRLRGWRRRKGS
jgi:hypothetical protein